MNDRMKKVSLLLSSHGMEALLIATSPDLRYLTNLDPIDDERFKGICIYADGRVFAICPSLCRDEFKEDLDNDAHIFAWDDAYGVASAFEAAFNEYGIPRTLGVNEAVRAADILPIAKKYGIELLPARKVVGQVRMNKTPEEVERLCKVGSLADEALRQLVDFIVPGTSESTLKRRLRDIYESIGGERISYVVATGPNSALPHYNKGDRVVGERDVVLIDFGGSHNGYRSDMTRTFFVGGPTEEQKKVYSIVLEAQLAGEAAVREGIRACDIDRAVRGVIEKAGYGPFFTHRTGHSIGIVGHDPMPDISSTDETVLREGITFSIEPGIYLPGRFGVRIENCVAVTRTGALSFTKFPREMTVL
ncbi:MAG TPA: aminopeptidase P family protein [Synergistaceae bacterium]|jgi:Xaa-Pro dipeptidase|nr:aminopeptidase P family protein [Synergistaceae bacterium]